MSFVSVACTHILWQEIEELIYLLVDNSWDFIFEAYVQLLFILLSRMGCDCFIVYVRPFSYEL